jgi:acetyl esterase/lipase
MVEYRTHTLENGGSPELSAHSVMTAPPELPERSPIPAYTCSINGVPGVWVAGETRSRAAVLYFHGGGFTRGSAWDALTFLKVLQEELSVDAYAVDYGLSPDRKYPHQLREGEAFYRGLLELGYEKIFLVGDSSGGNLAVALSLRLMALNKPKPACVVSMSGLLDFSCDKGQDFLQCGLEGVLKEYTYDQDPLMPGVSPVYAKLDGFPPLLLQAGTEESFRYHMERMALRSSDADCRCVASLWEGMGHDFTMEFEQYPEAQAALREVLAFLEEHL